MLILIWGNDFFKADKLKCCGCNYAGTSAFSDAVDEIKNMEPDATILDGLHIGSSSVTDAESRVSEWVQGLGLSK